MIDSPRIDKYLWAIRVYKTRNDAADACRSGKVSVNGLVAKPSKEVRVGDLLKVRKGAVHYSYQVLALITQRGSAKNLAPYVLDMTTPQELAKGEASKQSMVMQRDRGAGRPTKKERREIEQLMDTLIP